MAKVVVLLASTASARRQSPTSSNEKFGVTMSVAILIPVLRRPHRVLPTIQSVRETTSEYRLLFIASEDDEEEQRALRDNNADFITCGLSSETGQYARKINAGYRATTEPLLFLGADDLAFHPHWLERASSRLAEPGVGVVGTNDLGNRRVIAGEHATHSLVTRAYVDEFGTIDEPGKVLHEGYVHEYCDDELVGTAKKRGAWAFAADSVVEHLHPQFGKAPSDASYEAQNERMRMSRRLYVRRTRLWT